VPQPSWPVEWALAPQSSGRLLLAPPLDKLVQQELCRNKDAGGDCEKECIQERMPPRRNCNTPSSSCVSFLSDIPPVAAPVSRMCLLRYVGVRLRDPSCSSQRHHASTPSCVSSPSHARRAALALGSRQARPQQAPGRRKRTGQAPSSSKLDMSSWIVVLNVSSMSHTSLDTALTLLAW